MPAKPDDFADRILWLHFMKIRFGFDLPHENSHIFGRANLEDWRSLSC
jgi:hypothetical protein